MSNFTSEQNAIINAPFAKGTVTHINAFAGCGKTYTAKGVAEQYMADHAGSKILVMLFNKKNQVEASEKFGPLAQCRTSHSMAWHKGSQYQRAGQLGDNSLTSIVGSRGINLLFPNTERNDLFNYADVIQHTVRNFMLSGDLTMELAKVPSKFSLDQNFGVEFSTDAETESFRSKVLKCAKGYWNAMVDLSRTDVKLPSDGYIKLFQLDQCQLGFDLILFDEAQDANGATLAILANQKNTAIVMIGDAHQAIYQFRGADNAFGRLPASEGQTYSLSESFRFGAEIAKSASVILSGFKGESLSVKGYKEGDSISNALPEGAKHTILSRTNTGVFESAINALSNGLEVHIVGGSKGLKFNEIEDALYLSLQQPNKIKEKMVRDFHFNGGYDAFVEEMELSKDANYGRAIKMVENYGSELLGMIKEVKDCSVEECDADVVLSTGHKSKGMEWENVILADDFPSFFDKEGDRRADLSDAMVNLLYVMATRAESRLVPNTCLLEILGQN